MASDDGVQREAEIAQEVEAIEDLLGLRGTGADALGENLCAVAGDDLDTGMGPQPPGDTGGIPVRKQIDDGIPFEIDDHGPAAPPASPMTRVNPCRDAHRASRSIRASRVAFRSRYLDIHTQPEANHLFHAAALQCPSAAATSITDWRDAIE